MHARVNMSVVMPKPPTITSSFRSRLPPRRALTTDPNPHGFSVRGVMENPLDVYIAIRPTAPTRAPFSPHWLCIDGTNLPRSVFRYTPGPRRIREEDTNVT